LGNECDGKEVKKKPAIEKKKTSRGKRELTAS